MQESWSIVENYRDKSSKETNLFRIGSKMNFSG